jgi:hypothetical protein
MLSTGVPRVYRPSMGGIIPLWIVSLIGIGIGVGGAWELGADPSIGKRAFGLGCGLLFSGMGILVILNSLQMKIALYSDRMEIHGLGRRDIVRRDEVSGWRAINVNGFVGIIFNVRGSPQKDIKLEWIFKADAEFKTWMNSLPNPEGESRKPEETTVGPEAGGTSE